MKTIILIVLLLFASNVHAGVFGGGKSSALVKISTGEPGEKEFTFIDIGKFPVVYDAKMNQAHIGYHYRTDKDSFGQYKLIFLPLKTFSFDTDGQFKKWIKSVKKSFKCLTIEGIVKCD